MNIPPLLTDDVAYIHEFVKVMEPVAMALDRLQGGKNMYLGYLLPTVIRVKEMLRAMLTGPDQVKKCGPLIYALIAGLDKRFGQYLTDTRHSIYFRTVSSYCLLSDLLMQLEIAYGPFG